MKSKKELVEQIKELRKTNPIYKKIDLRQNLENINVALKNLTPAENTQSKIVYAPKPLGEINFQTSNIIQWRKKFLTTLKQDKQINREINSGGVLVKFEDKNNSFWYLVSNDFARNEGLVQTNYNKSDEQLDEILSYYPDLSKMTYEIYDKNKKFLKKSGAFIGFIFDADSDLIQNWEGSMSLSSYGIYTSFSKDHYQHNCLIKALMHSQKNEIIQLVKVALKGLLYVPTSILKQISTIINRQFEVYEYPSEPEAKKYKKLYGKEYSASPIKLALYDGHYFLRDENIKLVLNVLRNAPK